jgi:hypothetical protein
MDMRVIRKMAARQVQERHVAPGAGRHYGGNAQTPEEGRKKNRTAFVRLAAALGIQFSFAHRWLLRGRIST